MRYLFSLYLLATLTLSGCAVIDPYGILSRSIGNAPLPGKTLDLTTREAAFNFVWQSIDSGYFDSNFKGVNWKAIGERYRPVVLNSPDDPSFWKNLDRMVGELHDSHTRVESPQRYEAIKRDKYARANLGIQLAEKANQIIVRQVDPMSEAWLSGLRPGMRILSIKNEPALTWWHHALTNTREGSTPKTSQEYLNRELNFEKTDKVLEIEFERFDGQRITLGLNHNVSRVGPRVQALKIASGLGYLRLNAFDQKIQNETLKALESLREAQGIILDLRDNGGGSIDFARTLASQFVESKREVAHIQTRTGKPVSLLFGLYTFVEPEFTLQAKGKAFSQPLVILVNERSASASELVTASLQSLGRVHVIGEPSCGCLLGLLNYANIPGGGGLHYSELNFVFKDGRQVEGKGVELDEIIHFTSSDFANGRDPQFEAAVAWLKKAVQ